MKGGCHMKKSSYFAIGALVAIAAGAVVAFFTKNVNTWLIISFVGAVVALILSIVGMVVAGKEKASKAFPVTTLVIAIIACLFGGFMLIGMKAIKNPEYTKEFCKDLVNCKKDKDGVSICHIKGDDSKLIDIKCYDTVLTGDQYE